jgi:hypothetical protein
MPSSTFPGSCSAIDIDLVSHTCSGTTCHYICKATLKTGTGRTASALGEADSLQAASDRSQANATRLLQGDMSDAQTDAYPVSTRSIFLKGHRTRPYSIFQKIAWRLGRRREIYRS